MQTATDTIDPRSMRDDLERLKSGVAGTTADELALMKAKAARLSVLRREAQQHAEADERMLEMRIQEISGDFNERISQAHITMELRSAKIQQAYHASKSSLAHRIQEAKDRRIGKAQGTIMRNRQTRQQELDQAAASHAEFLEHLLTDRGVRRDLQKRILGIFKTFQLLIAGWFDVRRGGFSVDEELETPEKSREALLETLDQVRADVDAAASMPLVKLFRFIPLWFLTTVIMAMHIWYGHAHLVWPSRGWWRPARDVAFVPDCRGRCARTLDHCLAKRLARHPQVRRPTSDILIRAPQSLEFA